MQQQVVTVPAGIGPGMPFRIDTAAGQMEVRLACAPHSLEPVAPFP